MEKICSYQQYADVLGAFKEGKPRCATNKLMMRDDISALTDAGKLFYAEKNGVLWFFVNEGYYYAAHFHVPAGTSLQYPPPVWTRRSS